MKSTNSHGRPCDRGLHHVPVKFCLFFRVFFPSLSSADPSENPRFDLTHTLSDKLWPPFRDVSFGQTLEVSLRFRGGLALPVSVLQHLRPDGSLSDSVERGGM